jgi:Fe-S-cluster containining protein
MVGGGEETSMEVNCRGCAGCCLDWRPLAPVADHERRGPVTPLDDTYNLVPLGRDEVRAFVAAGYATAMTPRLWETEEREGVTIDDRELAAIDGRPAFFLGLRNAPKPVAPFGTESRWLPTCVFLDPQTLQCRIHDRDVYPSECAAYPGHNLALGAKTECERVEEHFDANRLVDDEPPEEVPDLLLGPHAVGQTIFVHPHPESLDGVVNRIESNNLRREDRASFVAAAAASAPGTTGIEHNHFETALERIRETDSWIEDAIEAWERHAASDAPDPGLATSIEDARGAPETPGWPVE